MVIRSDFPLGVLAFLAPLAVVIGLVASAVLLLARESRSAVKVFLITMAGLGAYAFAVASVTRLTSQRIVKIGDSYCWDSWCMGVERVNAEPRGQETVYKVDVHIFSDIGRGKTKADGAFPYLLDERGRRFSLVPDPSVIPFDQPLARDESINSSLTFVAPSDARQLFLAGEAPGEPLPLWTSLLVALLPMDPHFGWEERFMRKRTMLRVL